MRIQLTADAAGIEAIRLALIAQLPAAADWRGSEIEDNRCVTLWLRHSGKDLKLKVAPVSVDGLLGIQLLKAFALNIPIPVTGLALRIVAPLVKRYKLDLRGDTLVLPVSCVAAGVQVQSITVELSLP